MIQPVDELRLNPGGTLPDHEYAYVPELPLALTHTVGETPYATPTLPSARLPEEGERLTVGHTRLQTPIADNTQLPVNVETRKCTPSQPFEGPLASQLL